MRITLEGKTKIEPEKHFRILIGKYFIIKLHKKEYIPIYFIHADEKELLGWEFRIVGDVEDEKL